MSIIRNSMSINAIKTSFCDEALLCGGPVD